MYLRVTERRNRDGSTVAYYALAESVWNAEAKRPKRAWSTISAAPIRSTAPHCSAWSNSIKRVLDADAAGAIATRGKASSPRSTSSGCSNSASCLPPALCGRNSASAKRSAPALHAADLTAPHEIALFAMAANRLDDPVSKLACAERWLPDIAWLPDAAGLAVDQCYRALDFLAVWSDQIERDVFLRAADLFRLDVDLIFYDTTTAYFEIDEPDENEQECSPAGSTLRCVGAATARRAATTSRR